MLDPGEPTPPCGHPRLWRKITPFKTKNAFFTSKEQIFKMSSKEIFTALSGI
jgi:hypothetical protein